MYFCFVFCSPRSSACPFSLSRGWDKCANLKRKGLISRIKKDIFVISNMMDADSETVTFVSQLKFRCFDKDMWKNYILIVFRVLTFLSGPNSLQFFSSKNRLISSWFKFYNLIYTRIALFSSYMIALLLLYKNPISHLFTLQQHSLQNHYGILRISGHPISLLYTLKYGYCDL